MLQDALLVVRRSVASWQSVALQQQSRYLQGLVNKRSKLGGCGHWELLVEGTLHE